MRPRIVPSHGTRNRYQWRGGKCNCPKCRAAHAAYIRSYRQGQRGGEQLRLPDEYMPREKVA